MSDPMFKRIELRPLPGYKLRLRYADGAEGDVDLSGFAGRGVFELWNDYSAFERVDVTETVALETLGAEDVEPVTGHKILHVRELPAA
jgi:hypothetical protein